MFCPRCAQPSDNGQKFCRHCGFSLQAVSNLLIEATSTTESDKSRFERQQRRTIVGIFIFLLLWLITLLSQDLSGHDPLFSKVASYIGTVFFVLAIVLVLYVGIRQWLYQQPNDSTDGKQVQAETQQPNAKTAEFRREEKAERLLSESQLQPMPSVTEQTTELLSVEERRRAKES
jgi:hypothetical protein